MKSPTSFLASGGITVPKIGANKAGRNPPSCKICFFSLLEVLFSLTLAVLLYTLPVFSFLSAQEEYSPLEYREHNLQNSEGEACLHHE